MRHPQDEYEDLVFETGRREGVFQATFRIFLLVVFASVVWYILN